MPHPFHSFWVHYPGWNLRKMLRLSMSPTQGVNPIVMCAVAWCTRKQSALSWQPAHHIVCCLLPWACPGLPGIAHSSCLQSLGLQQCLRLLCPQHAWPAMETVAASLSKWYMFKNLKYYVFPTGASEDAGLSG